MGDDLPTFLDLRRDPDPLMLIQKPKTKQDLIQAIQRSTIRSVDVYEGQDLSRVPSRSDLERTKATVIVLRP